MKSDLSVSSVISNGGHSIGGVSTDSNRNYPLTARNATFEDEAMNQHDLNIADSNSKTPQKAPSREAVKGIETILSSSDSSDTMIDNVFLESSSSEENMNPRTPPSRVSNSYQHPMKTPGIGIPTPQNQQFVGHIQQLDTSIRLGGYSSFPHHSLRTVTESPAPHLTHHVNLSQSQSSSGEGSREGGECREGATELEEEDESAYLPDDFALTTTQNYTWEQVQRLIHQAEDDLRKRLDLEHLKSMEEFQEEVERHLQAHGAQWKQETEAEYARMTNLVRQERAKTEKRESQLKEMKNEVKNLESRLDARSQEHKTLEGEIDGLKEELRKAQEESAAAKAKTALLKELQKQTQDLEEELLALRKEEESETEKNYRHEKEREELRNAKKQAEKRVEELELQMVDLRNELNQKVSYLEVERYQERCKELEIEVKTLQESNENASSKISDLRGQLDVLQKHDLSNVEKLLLLQSEKEACVRRINELDEQLQSNLATCTRQVEDAKNEVTSLREDLELLRKEKLDISTKSEGYHKELLSANAEIDALNTLRADEQSQRQEEVANLKEQRDSLRQIVEKLESKLRKDFSSPETNSREVTASNSASSVEVLQSPTTRILAEDKSGNLRFWEELDVLQNERDMWEARVHRSEKTQKELVDSAVDQVRREYEKEIQFLKDKFDNTVQEFEAEKKTLKADLSVAEIQELTNEVEELKRRHGKELQEFKITFLSEKETELKAKEDQILHLKSKYEIELARLRETHGKEMQDLKSEIEELNLKHNEEIELVKATSREESEAKIKILEEKLDRLRIDFEDEKIEIIASRDSEQDELRKSLSEQQDELDCMRMQVHTLEQEVQSLRSQNSSISSTVSKEMQKRYEEELEIIKKKSEKDRAALQQSLDIVIIEKKEVANEASRLKAKLMEMDKKHISEIEQAKEQARNEIEQELRMLEATVKSMQLGDSELKKKLAEMESKAESDKDEYNRRIREVREEHNREIDELLEQLNLVEAEHNAQFAQKESLVQEKDAVISALGSQLAEAEKRLQAKNESQERLFTTLDEMREKLEIAKAEIDTKNKEISRLGTEHKVAMDEQIFLREKLCEEAREEMIERAQIQFEQANATYKKLKQEFDQAVAKIVSLEKELKTAKKELADTKKDHEAREVDLANELAQAKAAAASSDLNATRKVRLYLNEIEKCQKIESELRTQLEDALSTSRSVQKTLAAVVSEKEKLIQENAEMKAVCEELMAMVENNPPPS